MGSAFTLADAGVYWAQGDIHEAKMNLGFSALGMTADAGILKLAYKASKVGLAAKTAESAVTEISFGVKATKNSAHQINVHLTQSEAIDNLAANGYSKTLSKDGTVTIMTNGDKVYRFYPQSTGGAW
ncbi:hypothetical protein JCM19000A_43020 [Silvimonas sp. JCM 19000]